jgi:hypothetical protein
MKASISQRRKKGGLTRFDARSETYPLSKAKTYLGRLLNKAAKGQTVYIARGPHRFVIQSLPELSPIPLRPPGYFENCYTRDEILQENRLAEASVIEKPADLE